MKLGTRICTFFVIGLASLAMGSIFGGCEKGPTKTTASTPATNPVDTSERELELTRETIKMLDDIYKGGIVKITDQYVTKKSTIPAGTAFKQIFAIAKEKGWHEVRLLDATGDPYNDENVATDDFEKRAIEKIKAGTPYYEEIEKQGDQRYLRAMTAIPVALEKCTMCHSAYDDAKPGQAIGALGYRIKIKKWLNSK